MRPQPGGLESGDRLRGLIRGRRDASGLGSQLLRTPQAQGTALQLHEAALPEVGERQIHGLASDADQVRQVLLAQPERQQHAVRVLDSVVTREIPERLGELLAGSLITASSLIRPWQEGQLRTSTAKGCGLVDSALVKAAVAFARRRRVTVTVDSRFALARLRGMTAATPNESEVEEALGIAIGHDRRRLEAAGHTLLRRLGCQALLVTRGSDGMALFERGRPPLHVPVRDRHRLGRRAAGGRASGLGAGAGTAMRRAIR